MKTWYIKYILFFMCFVLIILQSRRITLLKEEVEWVKSDHYKEVERMTKMVEMLIEHKERIRKLEKIWE